MCYIYLLFTAAFFVLFSRAAGTLGIPAYFVRSLRGTFEARCGPFDDFVSKLHWKDSTRQHFAQHLDLATLQ